MIRTPRKLTICVIPLVSKSAGSLPSYFHISECFCACLLGVLVVKEDLRKKKKRLLHLGINRSLLQMTTFYVEITCVCVCVCVYMLKETLLGVWGNNIYFLSFHIMVKNALWKTAITS